MSKARVIAVANQKGGVGKTTTAVNLAAALADTATRVMLVDLDPQGNATMGAGVDKRELAASTCEMLLGEATLAEILQRSPENFDLLPGNSDLTAAEIRLMDEPEREQRLKRALAPVRDNYDYIIIDCPPSLSLLTLNALAAADSVLVPMQCEYFALEGLTSFADHHALKKQSIRRSRSGHPAHRIRRAQQPRERRIGRPAIAFR